MQWSSGPVVQWSSGPAVQWSSGPVVQWFGDDGVVMPLCTVRHHDISCEGRKLYGKQVSTLDDFFDAIDRDAGGRCVGQASTPFEPNVIGPS